MMAQEMDDGNAHLVEATQGVLEERELLFGDAPPNGIERRLGLTALHRLAPGRRALLFVMIGWAPLVAMAVLQHALTGAAGAGSIVREAGVHARYLIAVPLLVLADIACAPQLDALARHFKE